MGLSASGESPRRKRGTQVAAVHTIGAPHPPWVTDFRGESPGGPIVVVRWSFPAVARGGRANRGEASADSPTGDRRSRWEWTANSLSAGQACSRDRSRAVRDAAIARLIGRCREDGAGLEIPSARFGGRSQPFQPRV